MLIINENYYLSPYHIVKAVSKHKPVTNEVKRVHRVPLTDLAEVIRSKNAGLYELTLDIIFKSREIFDRVAALDFFTPGLFAKLYGIPEQQVLSVLEFAPARAIKATIVRPLVCGAIGDTDIYGARQHAPLPRVEVPWNHKNY